MSLILNIDTVIEVARVSLAGDAVIHSSRTNTIQKDHAAFLHMAIDDVLKEAAVHISSVDAIAVVHGPGSYTGIRVGMAAAKGLCYALNKPLLTISALESMAAAVMTTLQKENNNNRLICPMIDARRDEVFTAVYDASLKEVLPACAMILTPVSFNHLMEKSEMVFCGTGSKKWNLMTQNKQAKFIDQYDTGSSMASLSYSKFKTGDFADLTYSSPCYLKEFFSL